MQKSQDWGRCLLKRTSHFLQSYCLILSQIVPAMSILFQVKSCCSNIKSRIIPGPKDKLDDTYLGWFNVGCYGLGVKWLVTFLKGMTHIVIYHRLTEQMACHCIRLLIKEHSQFHIKYLIVMASTLI